MSAYLNVNLNIHATNTHYINANFFNQFKSLETRKT